MSSQKSKKYKRIIQLELNEITEEIINSLILKGELPNFKKIQSNWTFVKTKSESDYQNIEPWIQWVSAHTGKPLKDHNIFRLGDAHKLEHSQIWEVLSENNIESAIIGSMNVTRGKTKGGIFFPDPWAIKNETYPKSLKPLWNLISNKVQSHATQKLKLSETIAGFKNCLSLGINIRTYFTIAKQILTQKLNSKKKWKLAGIFDIFLTDIFSSVVAKTNYGFYTLFLNANAHYQHHYWRHFDNTGFNPSIKYSDIGGKDDPITYGYKLYDKVIGKVIDENLNDETLIIIASGLSQIPYHDKEEEGGMNYYRINDHKIFADLIGIKGDYEIYPLMSRDWQIKYSNQKAKAKAINILSSITVNNQPLFSINEDTDEYLFIETAFTKGINHDTTIMLNNEVLGNFNSYLSNISIKSGHHSGVGNLWLSDNLGIPSDTNLIDLEELFNITKENFTAQN